MRYFGSGKEKLFMTDSEYGILLLGHGSREAQSNEEFETLVSLYSRCCPRATVRLAYVELAKPDLRTALIKIAKTHSKIVVVPVFLFTSGHIKNDIPLILDEMKLRFPQHEWIAADSFGVEPRMLEVIRQRVAEGASLSLAQGQRTGVLVVGRGSSDADANGDFHKLVRLFEEGAGFAFVMPTFIGITRPLLTETLEIAARLRPERLIVVPYFLFQGKLILRIAKMVSEFRAQYPWIQTELSPYLGIHPVIFEIIDSRIKAATEGGLPLPCVTCEYRSELPGLSSKVGGLNALLWSLRHLETHTQAGPHEFPHKNLKKHILVCENVDCAARGSIALVSRLRNLIKEHRRQTDFKVTRTSCMGRCGEGPTVVVYPDGVWYRKVGVEDAERLVEDHLLKDRLVTHLVDNIM
jgi:sirohydrochlorin ferrochelatase/(2Fe-2S) ferredoxin